MKRWMLSIVVATVVAVLPTTGFAQPADGSAQDVRDAEKRSDVHEAGDGHGEDGGGGFSDRVRRRR